MKAKKPKFKIGDMVDYHAVIDGEITSRNHMVESTGEMCGTNVCWISREDALTYHKPNEDSEPKS